MPERLRDFCLLAVNTGARKGVLRRPVWEDVDFARNVVDLRRTKNKDVREIAMTERLRSRLKAKKAARFIPMDGPDLVLPELPKTWTGQIAKLFRKAAAKVPRSLASTWPSSPGRAYSA
jgi:integrase